MDSHADTCAFGHNALVVQDTGKTVTVEGFDGSSKNASVKVATVAVAYDCPITFKVYILHFPQSLYIPGLTKHLINPFQLRQQGIKINDVPLIHTEASKRTDATHSIATEDGTLHIPMVLEGIMSGFTTRKPTWDEVNDKDEQETTHVQMTNTADWTPYSSTAAQEESTLRDAMNSDVDIRIYESRQISPLHLRGQCSGDMEDDLSLDTAETALETDVSEDGS